MQGTTSGFIRTLKHTSLRRVAYGTGTRLLRGCDCRCRKFRLFRIYNKSFKFWKRENLQCQTFGLVRSLYVGACSTGSRAEVAPACCIVGHGPRCMYYLPQKTPPSLTIHGYKCFWFRNHKCLRNILCATTVWSRCSIDSTEWRQGRRKYRTILRNSSRLPEERENRISFKYSGSKHHLRTCCELWSYCVELTMFIWTIANSTKNNPK